MIAAKVATMRRCDTLKQNTDTPDGETAKLSHKDSAAAAAELNVGTSSLDRARRLQRDGIPELQDMVNTGEIKVTTAAEVSKLPEHNQQNLSVEYLPIA